MENNNAVTAKQKQFYDMLFSNFDNYVEVRLIDKDGKPKQKFMTVKELMKYKAPQDKNVYIGMFERKKKNNGKIENCTKTNVIYLDFDNTTLETIKYAIDMKGIPTPSMIVNSGHGYHVYWKLNKPAGHEVKPLISELANKLQADSLAVDIARILRVPDTMNIKEKPVPSKLIEINDNITTLKQLESLLGVKAAIEHATGTGGVVKELENIKYNGLNNMAKGVSKGERNFCTGRIVQTLKRLNYTRQQTVDIVFRWNTLNKPQKDTKELKQDIRNFWFEDKYNYYGKEFTEERLQILNNKFTDDETVYFIAENNNYHTYDNDLLGDKFHKISGLTFAVLSIIKIAEGKGITLKHIADISKRHTRDKTLLEALDFLNKANHISKKTKLGKATIYTFKEKPFSNKRGFTSVPKLLHRLYIEACNARELEKELNITTNSSRSYGRLNETRYKLLILLESYAYDSKREIYPTNRTIADRMRVTTETVKNNLKWLEYNQFIRTYKLDNTRYIELIYA